MRKALAIAGSNLRRTLRERTNLFFVFLFPMLLIFLLGFVFGGQTAPRIGVVAVDVGPLGRQLVRAIEARDVEVVRVNEEADLLKRVERGALQAGVVIPRGYDAAVRGGEQVQVRFVARQDQMRLGPAVSGAVADQNARVRAARFAVAQGAGGFDEELRAATAAADIVPTVGVSVRTVGEQLFPQTGNQFDLGAPGELLLFVFLTSITGSVALIETRRLGVSRRMLSTPTPVRTILGGEGLGRFAVAMVQGLFILFGSLLLFGVDWGDPLGALALLVTFGLVGAGAGMLAGSTFRNEQQATSVGILAGLGLAALGGCMVPLEFFSPTMANVAHITPHAWAMDGFGDLIRHDATFADVLPEVLVLLGFAAALFALATWSLRRAITR